MTIRPRSPWSPPSSPTGCPRNSSNLELARDMEAIVRRAARSHAPSASSAANSSRAQRRADRASGHRASGVRKVSRRDLPIVVAQAGRRYHRRHHHVDRATASACRSSPRGIGGVHRTPPRTAAWVWISAQTCRNWQ
ncbi:MAG: hypothetical protein R3A10_21155 [Caldilineaceae bacterium]